ncbi:M24 family metallopeptidase [Labrys monachus]|uniref:Xaa-Pro dipeptidase n=1 Tax=Labrys monachus TaxID=217067 RepID=A0ABU0FII8_9HYPH|nr:Xaa-Pro peptidase family protein [Labrys monachus]MDQ0393885.1 Xaa-Pro dipeptidase [Labrys monachus]
MLPLSDETLGGIASGRGSECAFPPAELAGRLDRLRGAMEMSGFDGVMLTGPETVFWLTGRQTPGHFAFQALFVPLDRDPVLLVRRLEEMNTRFNTRLDDIRLYGDDDDPAQAALALVDGLGWRGRRIGVETRSTGLLPALFAAVAAALPDWRDASGLLAELRMVKSALEVAFIEQAAAYADAGLEAGIAAVRAGSTENAIAAAMLQAAVAAGSEYLGMEPLVSSGPRSGVPHATWRRRRLERGDGLFLELAGCHNRYHAAILRPVWLGPMPDTARRMLDAAQAGLAAALDALRPGSTCADVHQAAAEVIDRHGYAAAYRKRTGYSMGVAFAPDWGEGDVLSLYSNVTRPLEAGMVFHIPTTLRAYGEFTIGVSETAVVTQSGARCLSRLPRRLFQID